MTVVMLSSCENNGDTVSEQALLSIRKFSQTYPSPKDAQPVVYMILCVGIEDNTPITNAIFGDSSHIIMGTRDSPSGGSSFIMEDQLTDERWTLSLDRFEQVIVLKDRSVQKVSKFARIEGGDIKFSDTKNKLLNSVVEAYNRNLREQIDAD